VASIHPPPSYRDCALPNELSEHGAPAVNRPRLSALRERCITAKLQGRGAGWTNRTSAPRLQGETSATEGKPAGKWTNGRSLRCASPRRDGGTIVQFLLDVSLFKQPGRKRPHTRKNSPPRRTPRGQTRSCRLGVPGHLPLSCLSAEGLALRRLFRSRKPWFGCFGLLERTADAQMPPIARSIARPGGGHQGGI
jgi:hypothetical protein